MAEFFSKNLIKSINPQIQHAQSLSTRHEENLHKRHIKIKLLKTRGKGNQCSENNKFKVLKSVMGILCQQQ